MLRLYQPCLPTRSMKAPTGPLWVHEIKHDGFRIVARRVGGVVRLQTKHDYDYAERYPLIVEANRASKGFVDRHRRRGYVLHRSSARLRQALEPHARSRGQALRVRFA